MTLCWVQSADSGTVAVRPSISLEGRYDSNVFFTEDRKSDFVTTVSPKIEINRKEKRFSLNWFYQLNVKTYSRYSELNDLSHTASADMDMELSEKTSLSLTDSFFFTQESLEAEETGIQTGHFDIVSNTVSLAMEHKLTPLTSLSATLTNYILEYENPTLVDSITNSASLTVSRELTQTLSINTVYKYTNFYFDTPTGGGGTHTDNHSATLGLTRRLSPSSSLDLSGGVVYTPDDASGDSQTNLTAGAGIEKSFETSTFRLRYDRDVRTTSGLSSETSISDRGSVGWNLALSNSFSVDLNGSISKNRSEATSTVDTTSYGAGVTANWRPYEWMTIAAGYSRYQQRSGGVAGEDLERNQVFMSITARPSEWRL